MEEVTHKEDTSFDPHKRGTAYPIVGLMILLVIFIMCWQIADFFWPSFNAWLIDQLQHRAPDMNPV